MVSRLLSKNGLDIIVVVPLRVDTRLSHKSTSYNGSIDPLDNHFANFVHAVSKVFPEVLLKIPPTMPGVLEIGVTGGAPMYIHQQGVRARSSGGSQEPSFNGFVSTLAVGNFKSSCLEDRYDLVSPSVEIRKFLLLFTFQFTAVNLVRSTGVFRHVDQSLPSNT